MDEFTRSYLQDGLACAILKKYAKFLGKNSVGDIPTIKSIAERMLNDGTITQNGYNQINVMCETAEGLIYPVDKDNINNCLVTAAVKCFMKCTPVQGDTEFAQKLGALNEKREALKAEYIQLATEYQLDAMAKAIIDKYIPASVTEKFIGADVEDIIL